MKKILVGFTVVLFSCGSTSETNAAQSSDIISDTTVAAEPAERNPYEREWTNFKIAIDDKDGPAIAYFIATESIDVDGLLQIFSDTAYSKKLENTTYDQLTDAEWEGIAVKEFRADIDYTDEDGNTFESAVFLYFEERENRLKLINVLLAG